MDSCSKDSLVYYSRLLWIGEVKEGRCVWGVFGNLGVVVCLCMCNNVVVVMWVQVGGVLVQLVASGFQ